MAYWISFGRKEGIAVKVVGKYHHHIHWRNEVIWKNDKTGIDCLDK